MKDVTSRGPWWLWVVAVLAAVGVQGVKADPFEFSFTDLTGTVQSGSKYRGKWVVVNFWATYCPPCLRELPELNRFHQRHRDRDAVVLGLNNEDLSPQLLQQFVKNAGLSFPVANIPGDQQTVFGSISFIPTTFIIAPDGQLVAAQQGAITEAALEAYIARKQAEQGS